MAIYVRNIDEDLRLFRNALRRAGPGWTNIQKAVNKDIATYIERKAQMMGETKQQVVPSKKTPVPPPIRVIKGQGTIRAAKVFIPPSHPYAAGALFGGYRPQFPEWVGNTWEVGGAGGPAAINPAIRESKDDIVQAYGDAFEYMSSVLIRAFPDGLPARRSPIFKGTGSF